MLNGKPASLSAFAGKAGNVTWNFEKFLVDKDGQVVRRFRPKVVPEDPQIVEAIESLL